ncbi:MAG: class II fructose-bisphosphate aldolase [Oscillospiraceae bacterium]|nr:class II fructose-bisphosphate aldolase [Oscillospiraceae bacterium]
MKANLREMLRKADDGGYAVPAFNYSDIWDFLAIMEAAEEERSPVILSSNPLVVEAIGPEMCGAIGAAAMGKASVPAIHHLDHSSSVSLCKTAIDNAYPSVMIDASAHELEKNIGMVKEVIAYARPKGVHVESELGRIKGRGIEGDYKDGDFLVVTEEAVRFVRETGTDSLAIGIGTAHGFYAGKPEIDFRRLKEVNDAVDTPLVLHGGTGIPREDVERAIRNGINKVNVGTIIHCTYMNSMREELAGLAENPYTLQVVKPVLAKIKEVVKGWIRVCMANGKA